MQSTCLWLINGLEGYGVRRGTLSLAGELRERGIRIVFASLEEESFVLELREMGYTVKVLEGKRLEVIEKRGLAYFFELLGCLKDTRRRVFQLREFAEGVKPDWLHLRHNTTLPVAAMYARKAGVKGFWHIPNEIRRRLPFNLMALSYRALCRWGGIKPLPNSYYTMRTLGTSWVSPEVLYLGINSEEFSPENQMEVDLRAEHGLNEAIPVFAIIGRLIPAKGQDLVVRAADILHRQGKQFYLVLVGGPLDSDFGTRIREIIAQCLCPDLFRLPGPTSDPRGYFQLADVVVNSRRNAEPFGLTIIEAMHMAKPVLAYRAGGPGETVIDNETGWLIESSTVDSWREGLEKVLADKQRWRDLGAAGRKRALSQFSSKAYAERYLNIVWRSIGAGEKR